jgi:membrane protein
VKIGRYEVVPTTVAIVKDIMRDQVTVLAAGVAYHTLFAFVPLLLFLTAMVGIVSRMIGIDSVMNNLTDWLFNRSGLPPAAAETLRGPIETIVTTQSEAAISFGAVFALWGAKNAISSMMRALNVAFDVPEGRPWILKTAISIGLTISIGIGLLLVSLLLLAGGNAGATLANWLNVGDQFQAVWSYARWIIVPLMLVLGLAVLYWAGPNVKAPFRWVTPGAVIAVLGFGLATWLLGFYFQYAAGYVNAYGVLGGMMAFVFWLYVMAVIALAGGSINSVLLQHVGDRAMPRYQPEPGTVPAEQPTPTPAPNVDGTPAHPPVTDPASEPSATEKNAVPAGTSASVAGEREMVPNGNRSRGVLRRLGVAATAATSAALIRRIADRNE